MGATQRQLSSQADLRCRSPGATAPGRRFRTMRWTVERLSNLGLREREALFDNARRLGGRDAEEIIRLLVDNDLLVREGGGLARDHPTIQEMEEIIRSDEGRQSA